MTLTFQRSVPPNALRTWLGAAERADHFPAFRSEDGHHRQEFRSESSFLSNTMFFPLFRLTFELWGKYHSEEMERIKEDEGRGAIAHAVAKVAVPDPEDPSRWVKVEHRGRKTSALEGRFWSRSATPTAISGQSSLSFTRRGSDAALYDLVKRGDVTLPPADCRRR